MKEDRIASIRRAWDERQERFGNTERSVLYKNLPASANRRLHRNHVRFILRNLPTSAPFVLDVGCGYGRLAHEVARARPGSTISGVELCAPFAEEFRKSFGECFAGSIEEYQPARVFDAIIIVTVLMYVDRRRVDQIVGKLWNALGKGGVLVCIEQCTNILIQMRRILGGSVLGPTGGDVTYFSPATLRDTLVTLPGSRLVDEACVGLFPVVNRPRMHQGFSLIKS